MRRFVLLAIVPASTCLFGPPAAARQVTAQVDGRRAPWDVGANPNYAFGIDDGGAPRYLFGLDLHPGTLVRVSATGTVTVPTDDVPPTRSGETGGTASRYVPLPGMPEFRGADQLSPGEQGVMESFRQPKSHASNSGMESETKGSDFPSINQSGIDLHAPHAVSGTSGPLGQTDQIANSRTGIHGTRFPSYYIATKHYPVRVNELVGAFVNADGAILAMPFPVGTGVTLRVPEQAAAIAFGLNSESFSSNNGVYIVSVTTNLPKVIVGPAEEK